MTTTTTGTCPECGAPTRPMYLITSTGRPVAGQKPLGRLCGACEWSEEDAR